MKHDATPFVWLNGQRLDWTAHDISELPPACRYLETDRALHYGHGVFETIRVVPTSAKYSHLSFLNLHLQRLEKGLFKLGFFPEENSYAAVDNFMRVIRAELKTLALTGAGILKILVTAGSAQRGYAYKNASAPRRFYFWSPLCASGLGEVTEKSLENTTERDAHGARANGSGLQTMVCQYRLASNPALAGIKHLNRLEQVLGALEVQRADMDDGLMLDQNEQVIETTSSNIFLVKAGQIYTPILTHCGIAGVLRSAILNASEFFRERKTKVQPTFQPVTVCTLRLADLWAADELFITNVVQGVRSIKSVTDAQTKTQKYEAGAVTNSVQTWLEAILKECHL